MSGEQIRLTAQLYGQGLSSMVVGSRLGFDNHTIIAALRSVGIVIRAPLGR